MGTLRTDLPLFFAAGVAAAVAHYGVLLFLVEILGIEAVIASTAGFSLGAIVSYLFNYKFTFASDAHHFVAFPKFAAIAILGAVFNASIMAVAVHRVGINYLAAQLAATATVFFWSYTANRRWTF